MMKALATTVGPAVAVDGTMFHDFPLAEELAVRSEAEVRACKVGYRAKLILAAARFLRDHPTHLDRGVLESGGCHPRFGHPVPGARNRPL